LQQGAAAVHYSIAILNRPPKMPFGEEAMKNHCAYCHGKFGLVRHRRAFKSFCSQKCVEQYKTWLRTEVGKRKGWSDCIWSASLSVVPYAGERSA
jgi:hypothetical protein